MENLENLKNNQAEHGGAREGAGRPKGRLSEANMLKRAAIERFKESVSKNVDRLLAAQLSTALGNQFLIKVELIDGFTKSEIVKDPEEILAFFNGDLDNTKTKYHYISTDKPDLKAIDSLLDRTFGKAKESIDIEDKTPRRKFVVEVIDSNPNRING